MKIGFDIDGVLREINLPLLKIMEDYPETKEWYYAGLKPLLNPILFIHQEDSMYIITVQKTEDKNHTMEWLDRFIPGKWKLIVLIDDWKPSEWKTPGKVFKRWIKLKGEAILKNKIKV